MDRPDLAVPEDDGLTRLADDLGAMQQHLNDKVRQMDGIVDRIQSRWQGATGEAYRGLQREVAQDAVRVRERLRVLEEAIRLSRDGFTEQELDALQAMRRVESGTDVAREAEALQSPTAAPPPDPVKEVQGMKPSVDPGGFPSGFDVSPTHVWYASYLIRNLQTAFNRPPGRLLDTLDDHKHVCGIGSGPSAFVAAYTEISALCLEVRALAVVAVGSVSNGLTITANNYVRAEYASIPGGGAPTSLKAVPDVIRQPPHHGRAADLGWAGSGRGAGRGGSARERVPQDLSALAERSGPGGAPGVWREIADHVDAWPRGVDAKLAAWVPGVGELRGRFPKLEGMLGVYFGQDGIAVEDPDLTDTERIGVFVADCHGRDLCTWRLPPLVGECAEALALFSDDALLGRFFGFELLLGSSSQTSWTAWLNLISDTLTTHLRREHGPLAWTGGREEPKPC
ncbi:MULTISPECIES: WXG100 family type VII secretion target [Streptomyces]|uniref:WXG100 family type VII secretion target n=1 Tax=Streptomyces TaxID=1883 RepID=UPI000A84756B|nr:MULTISPECIES: WXG100 family type VII secretion target [Streptomyces]